MTNAELADVIERRRQHLLECMPGGKAEWDARALLADCLNANARQIMSALRSAPDMHAPQEGE